MRQRFNPFRKAYDKLRFAARVNWIKTLYFNFAMFPFATARELPVYFYGPACFDDLSGSVSIEAPVRRAMIGFGQQYELRKRAAGTSQLTLQGKLVFKGHAQFGKDYLVFVARQATCTIGHMSSLSFSGKLLCYDGVILGNYVRVGFESQLINSTLHQMIDTGTGEKLAMTGPICLGSYNYIGNRSTIMKNTVTADYCTIASNSICNRDYSGFGNNILIGGSPATLLRENISRDWEGEREMMESWLKA